MKFTTIDIEKINLDDQRFRISVYDSWANLVQSINKAGLINPPVLTYRKSFPVILAGWKRILACQELSLSPINVFILDEQDDLEAFKIPVYDNLSVRDYSQIEKAEILKKLSDFGAYEKEIIQKFLPLLNIPPNLRHLDLYLALSRFDSKVKESLHSRNITMKVLQSLVNFSSKARVLIMPLLLAVGQNKQKELLMDLYDLTQKDSLSVEDVFAAQNFNEILSENKLSPVQKADKIRQLLKAKKNPALNSWNKAFELILKKLNVSSGIVISPSPYFESDDFSLNFSFRNREEFLKKLFKLQELGSQPDFSEIFKFSSDD